MAPSALSQALHIGIESQSLRFDWEDAQQVVAKVEEEWRELTQAIRDGDQAAVKDELGDVLFTTAQLARHLQLDPEQTLAQANQKFLQRFAQMEQLIQSDGHQLSQLAMGEMEMYWKKVKALERKDY